MDKNTFAIHLNELRNIATHTKASFDLFNQSLEAKSTVGVLYSLNSIMYYSSQMAAALWPTKARSRPRGEALREALQLPEKYALNDRRLIEMFDREDEKLDEWIAATKGKKSVFDYIGDFKKFGEDEIKEEAIYRAYDPARKILYIRGIAYSIDSIAKAVMEVGSRIMQAHGQMYPEQRAAEEAQLKEIERLNKEAAEKAKKEGAKKAAPKKKAPAKAKVAAKKAAAPKKAVAKKAAPKKATKK